MQTLIQHHGRTLTVDFEFNKKRNAVSWSLAIERGSEAVPLIGVITVLPADGERAEHLVKQAALAGLDWLEGRSVEQFSLGQGDGYSVAIARSPPLFEVRGAGHLASAFH